MTATKFFERLYLVPRSKTLAELAAPVPVERHEEGASANDMACLFALSRAQMQDLGEEASPDNKSELTTSGM